MISKEVDSDLAENISNSFFNELRGIVKEKGGICRVAENSGISTATLYKSFRNHNIQIDTVSKILASYGYRLEIVENEH